MKISVCERYYKISCTGIFFLVTFLSLNSTAALIVHLLQWQSFSINFYASHGLHDEKYVAHLKACLFSVSYFLSTNHAVTFAKCKGPDALACLVAIQ